MDTARLFQSGRSQAVRKKPFGLGSARVLTDLAPNGFHQPVSLKVAPRQVTADIRVADLQHHRTDVRVLKLNGAFAASRQPLLELPVVGRFVVSLASQLCSNMAR